MDDPKREPPHDLEYEPPKPERVPHYRTVMAASLMSGGAALFIMSVLAHSGAARANIWTAALAVFVMGLVVRFQHTRF